MQRLSYYGDSLTIPCKGSLIVPSNNIDILPLVNDFTQDPRRLTTAESPWGGVNGLVDYAPGSVHVEGDGIYLTDVAGNNTSKDLPAGLLSRLGYLTVDTVAHTITEEFIVANTGTSNNHVVIDACDGLTNWAIHEGTGALSIDTNKIKYVGKPTVSGYCRLKRVAAIDLSNKAFIQFTIQSSLNATIMRSDIINPVTGLLFPQYPEFVYTILIPTPVPTTQAAINALVDNSPELEQAKIAAQIRAENITAKTAIRTFVNVLNTGNKIDFEGTATIPPE